MGIRTLHRRTPESITRVWADTASAQAMPASPVPALAADASTARIPADPATTLRSTATRLRRGLAGLSGRVDHTPDWRSWVDLTRGYLALALTLLPRSRRPRQTLTVFVVSLTERPAAPDAPRNPQQLRRPGNRPGPGPDATA
ncbi:hypothetical protein [Streptomyces sp. NPDC040750]|uniref:hypothetical protein n=1 Tax=Streptomyces sp. NPDC040750 TaxID=3154491 RepID=UPI0033FA5E6A